MSDFTGTRWTFPIGVDARGRIGLAQGGQDIEEVMLIILLTPKGQWVMSLSEGRHLIDSYLLSSSI